MSHIFSALLGGAAVLVAFGAAQIASGNVLLDAAGATQSPSQADSVNRLTKSDSLPAPSATPGATKTVSVALSGLSNTSVLIRLPASLLRKEAVNAPSPAPATVRKAQVACEPVVSVLTDVAKQLQPGRCIT